MINQSELWQDFISLPEPAQKKVAELITSLKAQTAKDALARSPETSFLGNDPFVGLWKDRTDMAGSTQWVRALRLMKD